MSVSPNGVITCVSRLYLRSMSDKAKQSGLLNHLTAGDVALTDKGLVMLDFENIPPFLTRVHSPRVKQGQQRP